MRASGYARATHDWYVEPRWLVEALLDVEAFPGESWDPACGSGTIPKVLTARGLRCRGSDIVDRGYGEVRDFFACADRADNIISNPPFAPVELFVKHALSLATNKIAVIARLAFLEGQQRHEELFRTTPPSRVWVSRRRASMPPGGSGIKASGGSIPFAWFVWDKSHTGSTTLGWL